MRVVYECEAFYWDAKTKIIWRLRKAFIIFRIGRVCGFFVKLRKESRHIVYSELELTAGETYESQFAVRIPH